jgi:hypothetical protein
MKKLLKYLGIAIGGIALLVALMGLYIYKSDFP